MEEVKVVDLIKEIKDGITQRTSSNKDEVRVMKAMLNDRTYEVGVYNKTGRVDSFCPSAVAREMAATTMSKAAHMPLPEAKTLMEAHEFGSSEAAAMVGISKEFINTYVQTTRKLPLGGRESCDVSLSLKHVEGGIRRYPLAVGICADGKRITNTNSGEVVVPPYDTIKATGPCPAWKKEK